MVRRLVNDLVAAWNAHDSERVQSFYAPDCEEEDVAMPAPQRGSGTIRRTMKYYLRAFPDVQVSADEMVCDGDRAVLLWTWRGTHRGRFMNIPPTGRRVTVRGTTIMKVCDGRIHRVVRVWDVAGLLRALGLLPEL